MTNPSKQANDQDSNASSTKLAPECNEDDEGWKDKMMDLCNNVMDFHDLVVHEIMEDTVQSRITYEKADERISNISVYMSVRACVRLCSSVCLSTYLCVQVIG